MERRRWVHDNSQGQRNEGRTSVIPLPLCIQIYIHFGTGCVFRSETKEWKECQSEPPRDGTIIKVIWIEAIKNKTTSTLLIVLSSMDDCSCCGSFDARLRLYVPLQIGLRLHI